MLQPSLGPAPAPFGPRGPPLAVSRSCCPPNAGLPAALALSALSPQIGTGPRPCLGNSPACGSNWRPGAMMPGREPCNLATACAPSGMEPVSCQSQGLPSSYRPPLSPVPGPGRGVSPESSCWQGAAPWPSPPPLGACAKGVPVAHGIRQHTAAQTTTTRQEPHLDTEGERREISGAEDRDSLAREVQALREEIFRERESRKQRLGPLVAKAEGLERENAQLRMQLLKQQAADSDKLSDVTNIKREVVTKTMELEKAVREFQQTHQERLFAQVRGITDAMLSLGEGRPLPPARPPAGSADVPTSSAMNAETQEALRRRLESLGDVVVYTSDRTEACCGSGRVIPPGALRLRPRRCDHVFLVEALLPHWSEGLCPVCRCSFAYEGACTRSEPSVRGALADSLTEQQPVVAASASEAVGRGSRGHVPVRPGPGSASLSLGPRPWRRAGRSESPSPRSLSAGRNRRRRSSARGWGAASISSTPRGSAAGADQDMASLRSLSEMRSRASSAFASRRQPGPLREPQAASPTGRMPL